MPGNGRGRLFSAQNLLNNYRAGRDMVTREFPYVSRGSLNWLTMTAYLRVGQSGDPCAYVMVRRSTEEHLQKSIIDLYVYNNCDYFLYLDAKNNSYTMFSGTPSGTPLPLPKCDDYTAEMIHYAQTYVAKEDREYVISQMRLEWVLQQLEEKKVHTFFCGVDDPVAGYTRKRLDFRYYDRETKMILLTRTDVTAMYREEQKHHRALQEALDRAQTDSLTGVLNRQGIFELITQTFTKGAVKAALLFVDLDDFKQVNDTMGHKAGDDVLRMVAQALRREIRAEDFVGRIGGDEFVVFLTDITSREAAASCAGRICSAVSALSQEGDPVEVSCSIGVALAPEDGYDYDDLIQAADERAYRSKSAGKNRYTM